MDRESTSEAMLRLIGQAPMRDSTWETFTQAAEHGGPPAILRALEICIREGPDVARSVQKAGQVSFEAVQAQVRRLHDDWAQTQRTKK